MFLLAPILLFHVITTPSPRRDICGIANKRLAEVHTNWSHEGFKKTNLKAYCPSCRWVGENLARGQSDVHEAYRQWSLSPSHKANIDHPRRDRCLVSDTYKGITYYVEIFAQ